MNLDVFISYSHKDKTAADAACASLEAAGLRCWIAPRNILPGADWSASIIEAIDTCRAMVLIFSSSANESPQIRNEVVRAVNNRIPIFPIRIEVAEPTKSLAYFMGSVQWLDAITPPIEQHLQQLAPSIRALAQVQTITDTELKAGSESTLPRDSFQNERHPAAVRLPRGANASLLRWGLGAVAPLTAIALVAFVALGGNRGSVATDGKVGAPDQEVRVRLDVSEHPAAPNPLSPAPRPGATAQSGPVEPRPERIDASTPVVGPNILVLGDDADRDAIPRGNRIFNRVADGIAEQLITRGFRVVDEAAATMNVADPARARRSDAQLIELARAITQPPIDLILMFKIYASTAKSAYGDIYRPQIRVSGRIISVRSNRSLGSFEAGDDLDLPPLPRSCSVERECLLERVGAEARTIGASVGGALTVKLAAFMPAAPTPVPAPSTERAALPSQLSRDAAVPCTGMTGTPFILRLRGFNDNEINQLEDLISNFACYETHRIVRSSPTLTEYWYETRAEQTRLQRNLRATLEFLAVNGQISSSGNTIVVEKILTWPAAR